MNCMRKWCSFAMAAALMVLALPGMAAAPASSPLTERVMAFNPPPLEAGSRPSRRDSIPAESKRIDI